MRQGETVYFPGHGISKVESVEQKEFDGSNKEVLVLRVASSSMTVMVPKDNLAMLGIRPVISKNTTSELMSIISKANGPVKAQSWKDRNKEFLQKIRSGSPFELAQIIRDLSQLKEQKPLSFCEKRMYETARRLLGEEIAHVRKEKCDKVFTQIDVLSNGNGNGNGRKH
ncbi:MAG: hypothetical protein HYT87_01325 [Nitrospirae bacterium]|nr:hypothetical protein [Nitrospirota bacterium]